MDCEIWLTEYLTRKPGTHDKTIRREAKKAGFTKGQLKLARIVLGVRIRRTSPDGRVYAYNWFWYLPEDATC